MKIVNKIIRGTFGRVWVNNEQKANVKSFEAKVTANYEDVNINGDLGTRKRYTGYSIAGTMVLHKTGSETLRLYGDGLVTGQLPEVKVDAALRDPDSSGAQRVVLYDVLFDEVTLAQFENGAVLEESIPFTAGEYRITGLIDE